MQFCGSWGPKMRKRRNGDRLWRSVKWAKQPPNQTIGKTKKDLMTKQYQPSVPPSGGNWTKISLQQSKTEDPQKSPGMFFNLFPSSVEHLLLKFRRITRVTLETFNVTKLKNDWIQTTYFVCWCVVVSMTEEVKKGNPNRFLLFTSTFIQLFLFYVFFKTCLLNRFKYPRRKWLFNFSFIDVTLNVNA